MRKISKRQPDSKPLWSGDYLSIYLLDGHYETLHDGSGKFCAVLGYRRVRKEYEYLGRVEKCPPHQDDFALCSLTGGIEEGEQPLEAAKRELTEESGVDTDAPFKSLGTIRPSKMSDSKGWLYAIDLTDYPDQPKYEGKGDGSLGEKGAYCKWVSREEAINSKDPILATMIVRLGL